jgi:hypothetical protein
LERADSCPSTTTAVGVGSSGCSDNTSGGGCGSCWKGQTAVPLPPLQWGWVVVVVLIIPVVVGVVVG